MTILDTKRLFLRRFIPTDMNELYELVYADEIVKSTWSGATGTPDEIKGSFVKRNVKPDGNFGFRAIVRKEDNRLLGLMGYQQHLPDEDIPYLQTEEAPNRTINDDPSFVEVELNAWVLKILRFHLAYA